MSFYRIIIIFNNPVKHGYVDDPQKWEYGSLRNFHEYDAKEAIGIENEYPFGRVHVMDDF